jgi:hypothetical protein
MKNVKYILGNVFLCEKTGSAVVFIAHKDDRAHVWDVTLRVEDFPYAHELVAMLTPSGKHKRAITLIPKRLRPAEVAPIEAVEPDIQGKLDHFTKAVMGKTGVSSWLSVEDGKFKQHVDKICHASIASNGIVIRRHWEPIVHKYAMMTDSKKERYERWFGYVVNRSPWKHVFLTKDINAALKSHVEIDVNVVNYQVMGGITALRMGHEFPNIVEAYCQFLDDGFNEHDAFAMAGIVNREYILFSLQEGHTVFKNDHCIKEMFSFMHNGYAKPKANALPFKTHRRNGWGFNVQENIASENYDKVRNVPFIVNVKRGWNSIRTLVKDRFVEYVQQQEWKK